MARRDRREANVRDDGDRRNLCADLGGSERARRVPGSCVCADEQPLPLAAGDSEGELIARNGLDAERVYAPDQHASPALGFAAAGIRRQGEGGFWKHWTRAWIGRTLQRRGRCCRRQMAGPILACSSSRWRSKSSVSTFARPSPKTLVAPAAMAFFQSVTCIGWMSKFLAISWMVWTPLSTSSATRALNSGSCLLRLAFILDG